MDATRSSRSGSSASRIPQGNHGEDVKECYFYLDSTPTHSYAKALYKYPQAEFPYDHLVEENARRGKLEREYELQDTGLFDQGRYFDVFVEYAKAGPGRHLHPPHHLQSRAGAAPLHLLPTVWFRNTWTWGCTYEESCWLKPKLQQHGPTAISGAHATLGDFRFEIETPAPWLFTENETNNARSSRRPERLALCEGRVPRVRGPRAHGGGEPGGLRHEGGRALPAGCSRAGDGHAAHAAGRRGGSRAGDSGGGFGDFDGDLRRAHPGGG
jgi:hypothetical protein